MNKDSDIEIMIAANGFVVRPRTNPGEYLALSGVHVFSCLNDLSKWLFEHYGDHHAKPNDKGARK